MKTLTRTLTAVVGAAVMAAIAASPVRALGPTAMLFYGAPLKKSVMVTGTDTAPFGEMLLSQATVPAQDDGRPFISVALYYGQAADPGGNGVPLDKLTPEMAWQHGRFYPATADAPALLLTATFMKMARQPGPPPTRASAFGTGGALSPAAVTVLRRLGIPVGPGK